MAIELPRAGAGSVGSPGVRTTQLPNAGGVPQVRVASVPALQVPDLASTAGSGLEAAGKGLQEFGERLAAIGAEKQNRADSVETARKERAARKAYVTERFRQEDEEDMSLEGILEKQKQFADTYNKTAVKEFIGSDAARTEFEVTLEGLASDYATRTAISHTKATRSLVTIEIGEGLNEIAAQAKTDPANIDDAFAAVDKLVAKMAGALPVEDELRWAATGREIVTVGILKGFLDSGDWKAAKLTLDETPGIDRILGQEERRKIDKTIAQFETAERDAAIAGQRKLAEAQAILGPDTLITPAQRVRLSGLALPAAQRTLQDEVDEFVEVFRRQPTEAEKLRMADAAPPGAASTEGKQIQDRSTFVQQFGENSEQVRAFDELVAGGDEEISLTDIGGMRKEFTKLSGDFIKIRGSFEKIATTPETGAGDIALIFLFMKMIDPPSTVREGEFATAANAANVPDKLRVQYNKLVTGEKLAPQQRTDFRAAAELLMVASLKNQLAMERVFSKLAESSDLDASLVALDFIGDELRATTGGDSVTSRSGKGGGKPPSPVIQYNLDGTRVGAD